MTAVFFELYDPANALFAPSKSDPARATVYHCSQDDCPLRKVGQCIRARCPYGRLVVRRGPTGRAKGYGAWLNAQRAEFAALRGPNTPPNKIAFIGDYVYLPYAHMDMLPGPWLVQPTMFSTGVPFIPRSAWTVDFVLSLIDGSPQAYLGGEITNYREKSVPAFLTHLREVDPAMWRQVVERRPELDKAPNHIGRKALLRTLRPGITISASNAKYPVTWQWDGETLTTTDKAAYDSTWGNVKLASFVLAAIPEANATVNVESNDWVTPETVFVD